MEKSIVWTLVTAAGGAVAVTLLVFLGLLIHEIGAFCDEIGDPFQDERE